MENIMRSRFLVNVLPMLCSGAMLLACSSPAVRPENSPDAILPADDTYLRGRNLHLERRYDEAIAAYQATLKLDAAHVNAQNGLAIAYAERREFDKAIPLWRGLTQGATMTSGPGLAFLFANLGYAYFLQGDYDEASVALEKACLLDPLNARAWQYLGETLQRQGQEERAQQMLRQAKALRTHDLRADYAAAGGGARLPAIEQAVQAVRKPDESSHEWASVEVKTAANGLLKLRRVERPRTAPVALRETPVAPPVNDQVAALEISNGNGRHGLARQVAGQLRDPGVKVVRLTNEKGFAVRQTRIEYQPAFRNLAERLAARFGAGKPVEAKLPDRTDVRLVIGRDLPPQHAPSQPTEAVAQDRVASISAAP
jgi:tetratricopeptide (TPR) repeat protein